MLWKYGDDHVLVITRKRPAGCVKRWRVSWWLSLSLAVLSIDMPRALHAERVQRRKGSWPWANPHSVNLGDESRVPDGSKHSLLVS